MQIEPEIAMVAGLQYGLAGPFDCNVYALAGPEGVVLLDAGGGVGMPLLLDRLARAFPAQRCVGIVLTHCHPDHAAGAAGLQVALDCPVYAPLATASRIEMGDEEGMGLRAGKAAGVYPADFELRPCPIEKRIQDGDEFTLGGLEFQSLHIRGHSLDSTGYLVRIGGRKALFSGDIVFYGGVLGLINAEGSELSGYRADLPKLADLGVDALFPGHGLFTLQGGQRHLDYAIERIGRNFTPRMIGQWEQIF